MLVIRLARAGRKNQPTFRIVLQEKTQAPKSAAQEILGSLNPHLKERKDQVILKSDRIKFWLERGAQPSETIHNLLVEYGILQAPKRRVVRGKKKGAEGETAATEQAAPKEGASEAKTENPAT